MLVVGDDPTTRRLVTEALVRDRFAVAAADDGAQALAAIEREPPSLVLIDAEPLALDGFAVCEAIRRRTSAEGVPMLLITGSDDPDTIDRACEAGVTDFVRKPINAPLLAHRVRHLLQASHAMEKLADAAAELDRNRERLHELAYVDTLTRLPNRAAFLRAMEEEIARCHVGERSLAVMFLDVDNFKRVNDTLGHAVGDELLVTLAERLRRAVRSGDTAAASARRRTDAERDGSEVIARVGGDEFTVMLSGPVDAAVATAVARRLVEALDQPIVLGGCELVVSPSIGIALYPEHGEDADTLLRHADAAMYVAKRDGKNGFRFHEAANDRALVDALTLESRLRHALESDALSLVYQPQLDIGSSAIIGVEALLRWHDAELGVVGPDTFIPVAERSGLIGSIGHWVLVNACHAMAGWLAEGLSLARVAVNISARQFLAPDFVDQVAGALSASGLAAARLELEITESLLMENVDGAIRTMDALKELGVELAIDDFGTGYSSLGYLKRFPIDRLKIDRIFVRDILSDSDDAAITRAVIAMAHSMDLSVIAEGVECEEQLRFLTRLDCEEIQGYHLSRPLPADEIAAFLRAATASVSAAA